MTPLQRLLSYFKPYRGKLIFGVACVLGTNLAKMRVPFEVKHAIDSFEGGVTENSLLAFGGRIVLIAIFQGIFLFTQRRVLINMSREVEYDLRNDFYAHLQKLPFQFYQTNRTGDLMARATNDLSAVRMIVGPA